MINLIIYLNKNHDPVDLVEKLLMAQLIASASIDQNNESFTIKNDIFFKEVYSVITAQTKSLLFAEISRLIGEMYGPGVRMNASPIVASNKIFDELVKLKTLKT